MQLTTHIISVLFIPQWTQYSLNMQEKALKAYPLCLIFHFQPAMLPSMTCEHSSKYLMSYFQVLNTASRRYRFNPFIHVYIMYFIYVFESSRPLTRKIAR